MRKIVLAGLSLLLLLSLPFTAWGASNLSTEQKFEALKQKNIFTGFADGSSRLYEPMSREQLAAVLFRLMELPAGNAAPSYNDVLKTRWSFKEIEAVTRAQLMNGTKTRIFSPEANVTVEQLAVILVRSYGLSGGGSTPVTGRVSKWARGAVSLALDRKLIPQLGDYTVDANRGLLVEAAYTVYEDTHVEPLKVRSVEQISNQSVRINLLQWVNSYDTSIDTSRFVLKDGYGNSRTVYQATISQDGMSIVLWTDRQIAGLFHTLSIDGNVWSYTSASDDTTKPTIVSQPVKLPNRAYELRFSEPVDQSSATNANNYQFNNGLKIKTLQLSPDQRVVTFTTSDQAEDKTYQLTVRNVKDLAGNVMDTRSDLYINNVKPKVTEVKIDVTTAIVSVVFKEKIDPQQAVQTYHYSIDKGLVVTQAVLENDGKTVTLRTSPQQDGSYYTLTISGIPDLAGNVMDPSTNWKFGAVSNPVIQATVQSISAVNQNTLEIVFNRALSDADVKNVKITNLTDNGPGASMSDWSAFVQRTPGSDRAVTIQYRTRSSGNPALFTSGHVYTARVTGVAGLNASGGADTTAFGGTVVSNPVPYATQAIVLDGNTIKVMFSEPIKNASRFAFYINEKDGGELRIDSIDPDDKGNIVTEVILRLKDGLQPRKQYAVSFRPDTITDAAGWNGWKTAEGNQPFFVYFNT
ncbi:Ig-like domain-containing protein [Cohnella terricola]|uniref:SLH domain-containing protein n=1 Tax=Cohnella terricola TaxID=1289167 RepID=A0A559JST3_9BACL|nr:Ig-like domain-containing protein [Cohnella terricola]TVY02944.1 hypothetical protein FPZ45_03360 [Cohnella terricola]